MFDRINLLVSKHNFSLKVWDDRYSKGLWAVCTPNQWQADVIQEASEDGDLDMIPATEYVLATEWLPVVTAPSLLEALSALEDRLASLGDAELCRSSTWGTGVWDALEHLRDVRRASANYGGTDGHFRALPVTLQTLREQSAVVTTD
jgi:hypothetical protein